MSFYTDQRDKVADRQIRDKGLVMIVRVKGVGEVFDVTSGGITTVGTVSDHTTVGIFTKIQKSEWDSTLVETTDQQVLLSGKDFAAEIPVFVPEVGQQVVIASLVYEIKQLKPLSPGGVDILYKMMVRK